MLANYLFDVDGTLTPKGEKIDPEFKLFLCSWAMGKQFYLISSKEHEEIEKRLGEDLTSLADKIFCCHGNSHWQNGKEIYQVKWDPGQALVDFVKTELDTSKFPFKFGEHVDLRPGTINYSLIGENADPKLREFYAEWEQKFREREGWAKSILANFDNIDIRLEKNLSISIFPKEFDKSQVINCLDSPIYFFGDQISQSGNDYTLGRKLMLQNFENSTQNRVFSVQSWQDTYKHLKST